MTYIFIAGIFTVVGFIFGRLEKAPSVLDKRKYTKLSKMQWDNIVYLVETSTCRSRKIKYLAKHYKISESTIRKRLRKLKK